MAHKYGNTATPYKAPSRNPMDSIHGERVHDSQAMARTDPSSGEKRGTRKRTGNQRKAGVLPKPRS